MPKKKRKDAGRYIDAESQISSRLKQKNDHPRKNVGEKRGKKNLTNYAGYIDAFKKESKKFHGLKKKIIQKYRGIY